MKRSALSFFVVAASAAYVWNQSGAPDPLGWTGASASVQAESAQQRMLTSAVSPPSEPVAPLPRASSDVAVLGRSDLRPGSEPSTPPAPSLTASPARAPVAPLAAMPAPVTIPTPRPRPTNRAQRPTETVTAAAAKTQSYGGLADGNYTGPIVDAYYGLVQIQAVVQSGRLADINVLRYPSDRRTSVFINRQALPMLRSEVIAAQSANVDIISGATLTSEAFIQSLGTALRTARS